MRPQTKGAGSTDIFRVIAPQTPHYPRAGLHWRDNVLRIRVAASLRSAPHEFLIRYAS